jgi:EAL domain-containing protein (putative c-di-GMP-specific phosphodiesterase class I)
VKIDGGFVHDMLRDPSDYAMVEIINRIGHILGKQTIAEFVECKDIAIALQQIGVDYAQGYAVAMPEPLTQEFLSGGTLAQRALDSWQGSLTANP